METQVELIEKLKNLVKQAKEVADIVNNEYRVEAFARTYEFLLHIYEKELIRLIEVPAVTKPLVTKSMSLPEFLSRIKLKSNPQRITAIAYYIRFIENINEFTLEDLLNRWKAAALKMPGNPRRDLRIAIRRGWISPTENKKYYITNKGIEFIDNQLKSTESEEE